MYLLMFKLYIKIFNYKNVDNICIYEENENDSTDIFESY